MTVVAKNIFSYVSRKVKRAGAAPFLPMSKKEMETLGWDACDIIIRKITTNDQFYTGLQPTSVYNIEYTPKLIVRKTTAYARTTDEKDKKIK